MRAPMLPPGGTSHAKVQLGSYQFIKKGARRYDFTDPYHLAVTLTWPQFFAALLGLYLVVNTVFALLYAAQPHGLANAQTGTFIDDFFFSFETLATVGYGEMYPQTLYTHLVACAEIVCGLAFTAILTGLTFVRFSRPRGKFIFADNPVIARHNGKLTLMLRVANGRVNVMGDAQARMNILLSDVTPEGQRFRRALELKLARSHIPIFPLAWTIMHEIDEESPLFGMTAEQLIEEDARLFVTLQARDPLIEATVHEIRDFPPGAILMGMRYVDAVNSSASGIAEVDLSLIGAIEPDAGPENVANGYASKT